MHGPNLKLAYIGTSRSYFTRKFLPALQCTPNLQLTFVCVLQNELTIKPAKAAGFLKFLFQLKIIRNCFSELSSKYYWSIYCQQHKINFIQIKDINHAEIQSILNKCDFVLSAGIRNKLNLTILAASKNGIVNFHYSLLPKYRGTNPVFWQKVNGDLNFGYTFHLMNENMDRGNIILQNQVSVSNDQTVTIICDQLTDHASNQLFSLIQNLTNAEPQDELQASEFTNQDYLNYININTSDHGSIWFEKCNFANFFILNQRWLVRLEKCLTSNTSNKLSFNGTFSKDGYHFKFKKINYLPPVFFYFALKKYFG